MEPTFFEIKQKTQTRDVFNYEGSIFIQHIIYVFFFIALNKKEDWKMEQ